MTAGLPFEEVCDVELDVVQLGFPDGEFQRWSLVPGSIRSTQASIRFAARSRGETSEFIVRKTGSAYLIRGEMWADPSDEGECDLYMGSSSAVLTWQDEGWQLYLRMGWGG